MSEDTKKVKTRATYQRVYYLSNKERIKNARSKRYQNDNEFRDRINLQRRKSRNLKNMDSYQSIGSIKEEEVDILEDCMMKVMSPNQSKSHICKMYSITGVAMRIRVDKKRLEHLIYQGKVPRARYRNIKGWRVYTEYELKILMRAFARFRKQATLNNYKFRFTKEMADYINLKFSKLVGGIPTDMYTNEG